MFIKVGLTVLNSNQITKATFAPSRSADTGRSFPARLTLFLSGYDLEMVISGDHAEEVWASLSLIAKRDEAALYEVLDDEDWDLDDTVGIPGMTFDSSASRADLGDNLTIPKTPLSRGAIAPCARSD